jgi:outer membrane protein insertion porin family
MFVNYAYESVRMSDINEAFLDPTCIFDADANFDPNGCQDIDLGNLSASGLSDDVIASLQRNPFIFDSLLLGAGGRRTTSKVIPTFVHNTVDNPIFPNIGKRITLAIDLAMLGGNTQFYKPTAELIKFWRHTSRTSFGLRGQTQFIAPIRDTRTLPIFEKLFMGGEYTVRGFDIRSIGPSDPQTGLVLGGNKSFLFNAEYMVSIVSQVRLIFFYDAGQVADERQSFAMNLFRTSTGAEVRFFMPVLNVPFRLIFAANPQREGVRDNSLRPAKSFVFRFAVGSTF